MLRNMLIFLLMLLAGFSVVWAEGFPTQSIVLADTESSTPRNPRLFTIGDSLFLCWQSNGKAQMTPITTAASSLSFACIATADKMVELPLTQPVQRMTLDSPSVPYPAMSIFRGPKNAWYLGYESNLLPSGLGSRSVSIFRMDQIADKFTLSGKLSIPHRVSLNYSRAEIARAMTEEGLTEQQLLEKYGSPLPSEVGQHFTAPSMIYNSRQKIMFACGINPSPANKKGNLWLNHSTNGGKTWSPQHTIAATRYTPKLSTFKKSLFLLGVQRVEDPAMRYNIVGYWPDEMIADPFCWPYLGTISLQRWPANKVQPVDPPVTIVADTKCIEGTLAIRDDGLYALVYLRSDVPVKRQTSLWLTTSRDGLVWSQAKRLTEEQPFTWYRDANAIFYGKDLWISFSKTEQEKQQNIGLMVCKDLQ